MKKLLLFLPLLLIFSCSVQKRKYQNGYYVEWHHKKTTSEQTYASQKKSTKQAQKKDSSLVIEVTTGDKKDLSASQTTSPSFKKQHFFKKENGDTCDLIVFKDGSEIKAKVHEVGISDIKYKRCESLDGPFYVSRKSEIFMIKYANGTKEVIKSESPTPASTYTPPISSSNSYRSNKYNRITHPLSVPALALGIASIVSAYILLIFAWEGTIDSEAVLFLPFALGLIATVLGAISLSQIKNNPDVYKGKGLSIPGMIMGIVMASIMLLIIFAVFLW